MTGDERRNWIDELMDRSSLGAADVHDISERTSDDTLDSILRRTASEEMFDLLDPAGDAGFATADDEDDLGAFDPATWRRLR